MPLLVGPLIGVFAGTVVTKARIPSFIVTLGTLMMARSLTLVVTQGQPIPDIPDAIRAIGQGRWVQLPLPFNFNGLAASGSLADLIVWLPIQNILWVAVRRLRGRLVRAGAHRFRQARLRRRLQQDGRRAVRHPRRPDQDRTAS